MIIGILVKTCPESFESHKYHSVHYDILKMNLDTELQINLASLISFMLESICYGIYCLVFAAFIKIRLKTNNRSKALLYLITANFIACTANLAVDVIASQAGASLWVLFASNVLYTCVDFISQVILIYRCWIMWRQPWVMVVPILLTLVFLAISVVTLAKSPSSYADQLQATYDLYPLALTFFSLSLTQNALVTGLIIFKILTVYREIRGLESRVGRDIVPIISILIESGVVTFVVQLVQTLMYKFDTSAYPILGGLVVQLFGISTAIVLVRVEMGLTYEVDNKISTMRFAASSNHDITLP